MDGKQLTACMVSVEMVCGKECRYLWLVFFLGGDWSCGGTDAKCR